MVSDSERKRLVLELANLMEEQEACQRQYRSTIDEAQRVCLKRKLDDFDQKINDINRLLFGQDLTANTNRRSRALEQYLSKIDFKKQIEIFTNIFDNFEEEYGGALFFINDSLHMAGDLLSLELQNYLQNNTTHLKPYKVVFSVESRLDEIGFLQRLGGQLGIDEIKTKEEYFKVIEKLFNVIENGSIVLIEVAKFDLLDSKTEFFYWLVDRFWKSLVKQLPSICELKKIEQVRFIILVTSDDDISDECSSMSFCCQEECFNICQIFAIILTQWSEKEIRLWLTKHSGLPTNQITPMAKSVYNSSRGGTPKLICEALKNKLS